MKCFVRTLCLIPMLALMTPTTVFAQDHGAKSAEEPKKKRMVLTSDATTLQLKFFLAPVQSKPGSLTSTMRMVTPILKVPNPKYSPLICHRMPRVIEALLSYFSQYPAPVDRTRHIDSTALEAQKEKMAAYVNRALGHNVVSAVYVFEGGKSMSSGVAARFPGASSNACGAILEENEKKLKEAEKPK